MSLGQRSERLKWIYCFELVTRILFCVAMSEYDQVLLEDPSVGCFEESLVLSESVINSRKSPPSEPRGVQNTDMWYYSEFLAWFNQTSFELILNKKDIFIEKIKCVPLERYFVDYTGGTDLSAAYDYFVQRFRELNHSMRPLYFHMTQAIATKDVADIFGDIKGWIIQKILKDTNML